MKWVITADLHLDIKPHHEYRWGIFDWLAKQKCDRYFILGDLTDEKDCHSATLVNKMVDGLRKLKPPVFILKGNHDYVDKNNPYFGFLNHIDGLTFITKPTEITMDMFAIPHQPDQASFDKACAMLQPKLPYFTVFLHGLFEGAIGDTGQRLSGLRPTLVEKMKPGVVWAGDVHAPQQAGIITYVGAPYRVRFGDNYVPRVVLQTDDTKHRDLHYPCPMKHSITIHAGDSSSLSTGTKPGDQVKITILLPREEAVQWDKHKQRAIGACRDLSLEVFGVQLKLPEAKAITRSSIRPQQTHIEILENFCSAEGVPGEIKEAGLALIK